MSALLSLINRSPHAERHRPWPRIGVDEETWRLASDRLAAGHWSLLGLWAGNAVVHAAVLDGDAIAVLSFDCNEGAFPSLGQHHPPALRLERAIRDLWGLEPRGLADTRPWLDHGRWGSRSPVAGGRTLGSDGNATTSGPYYRFLPAEGESLHEIPVGPVHAGIIEPGHFRFSANGETVVRLEARLGYVHKGIERLMIGADLDRGAVLAGRCSGDSTAAYALAFARAAEAALGIEAPSRAHWLRALMAELERLANHLGDIGAICNDAAFTLMHTHCGILRERVLRAADACFGHRLMRDLIVPGGVIVDIDARSEQTIRELLAEIRHRFPGLIELYDNTASLQDRTVGTGVLKHELARQYAAGGYVGRASGRGFDARRTPGYPPYHDLELSIPVLDQGDVNARVWIRIREIEQSLAIIDQILERLPSGAVRVDLPRCSGEGMALIEGFRGDVLIWLSLAQDATVSRCHLRDPSWFQWPLLEAAIEGNIVADFPLCNKSFNCSYSGQDL
jgi:Ni,Fe-hydrogenase III large subunit